MPDSGFAVAPMIRRCISNFTRAAADPIPPVAVEIWEKRVAQSTGAKAAPAVAGPPRSSGGVEYTPAQEQTTGFYSSKLPAPLVWPEFDQSRKPGKDASSFLDRPFDSINMIGEYPHIRSQYSILKDPHIYWDQQGRREYGEVLFDHDNFTDIWGIGPEMDPAIPRRALMRVAAYVAGLLALVAVWDPQSRVPWVIIHSSRRQKSIRLTACVFSLAQTL